MDLCNNNEAGASVSFEQLPNDIWLSITGFLSHRKLLEMRLVCKRWLEVVNRIVFVKRGRVVVHQRNLNAMTVQVRAGHVFMPFTSVLLWDLRVCKDLEELLSLVGKEVKYLEMKDASVFESINGRLPNLESLSIGINQSVDENIDINQFKLLHSLQWDGFSLQPENKSKLLNQLLVNKNKLRLRSFQFDYYSKNEALLLDVLSEHADSLESLDIFLTSTHGKNLPKWRQTFERFKRVRILKLSGSCDRDLLEVIVKSLPSTLPLRQLHLNGLFCLDKDQLLTVARKWRLLSSLNLLFCINLDDKCAPALQELSSSLKTFTMSYDQEMTGTALYKGLAMKPNYLLRELYLTEMCVLTEEPLCKLLENLPALQVLNLDNCRFAVTNRTLATIFKHQTQLLELNIDNCDQITDKGLLGLSDQPNAIRCLKGLRALQMRGCYRLSNRVLIQALILPELRHLSIGNCHRFKAYALEVLTRNCPNLERFCLNGNKEVDDDCLYHIMRNLKRLRYLNLSNCVKLTKLSVQIIAEYGTNLKELSAHGVDGFHPIESQTILEELCPLLKCYFI